MNTIKSNMPNSKSLSANSAETGSGFVQVAIWKDNAEWAKYQDVFTTYSQEVFYDFTKPLRLLDAPGWSAEIKTDAADADGFFVLTSDEKPF